MTVTEYVIAEYTPLVLTELLSRRPEWKTSSSSLSRPHPWEPDRWPRATGWCCITANVLRMHPTP